jgi:hypothetical protein
MSNFGGRLGQPKNETYSRDFFFSANIIQHVVDFETDYMYRIIINDCPIAVGVGDVLNVPQAS